MGDVAMTVPVLQALTRQYPDLHITVLTRPFFSPMFLELSNVKVYGADLKGKHKGLFGLWRLYRELKGLGFGAVVDLHNVLRTKILRVFFFLGGIPFFQIDKGRRAKRRLTRGTNKVFLQLKTTHQRYADVFAQMGFPLDISNVPVLPKGPFSPKLKDLVGPKDRKWLGIAPFAAFPGKQYPLEMIKNVIEALLNTKEYTVMLFGGGAHEAQLLQTLANGHQGCINVCGKFSFAEELVLISHLDALLAMDSGNGHLAAIYGVPVISLWGVTHPYAGFAPFGQPMENSLMADRKAYPLIPTSVYGNRYPEDYAHAIATIPVKEVVLKIHQVCQVK